MGESLRRFHCESSRSLSARTIGVGAGVGAGDEAGGVVSATAFLLKGFEFGFGGERRDSLSQPSARSRARRSSSDLLDLGFSPGPPSSTSRGGASAGPIPVAGSAHASDEPLPLSP